MKTPSLFLVLLITSGMAYAQSKERRIAYLSKNNKEVSSPTNAAYYRTVQEAGEGFIIREYFLPSSKVRLIAECMEYEPEIVYHGKVKRFYESGVVREEEEYDEGYATGISTEYYETGKVFERKEHQSDDKVLILQHYTPDGRELLTNGNGMIKSMSPAGDTIYAEIRDHVVALQYNVHAGDTVYSMPEKQAEYVGGMGMLMKFLQQNVKYPADARRSGAQGTVFTMFVVGKDGSISNVAPVMNVNSDLDAEAVRVVSAMPKWKPAEVRGRVVKSRFVLPIKFRLAGSRR
jgi:TonB family protein